MRRDIGDIIVFAFDEINMVNITVKPLVESLGSQRISWCNACRDGNFSHPKQSGCIISIWVYFSLLHVKGLGRCIVGNDSRDQFQVGVSSISLWIFWKRRVSFGWILGRTIANRWGCILCCRKRLCNLGWWHRCKQTPNHLDTKSNLGQAAQFLVSSLPVGNILVQVSEIIQGCMGDVFKSVQSANCIWLNNPRAPGSTAAIDHNTLCHFWLVSFMWWQDWV